MGKKVVITGATGSVGLGLIQELNKEGYEILVITRSESNRNEYIPKYDSIKIIYCQLSELNSISKNELGKYDYFFHMAWSGTDGNLRDDLKTQYENVKYTLDAVKLAYDLGCHTFVCTGSQAECGRVNNKISSSTMCYPESAYGGAKLSALHLSRIYANQLKIKHIWVRLLTVYGPLDKSGFVVPTIKAVKTGEIPKFTKGEQIWDFLYYRDAGNALKLIGEKGTDGGIYVIGCGEEKRLSAYIQQMNDILSPDISFDIGAIPYSKNQVMYLCADNSRVQADVGWTPMTDFVTGIRETERYIDNIGI